MVVNCKSNQDLVKSECSKCVTKCNPDQERNPKTGRCVLKKTSKKKSSPKPRKTRKAKAKAPSPKKKSPPKSTSLLTTQFQFKNVMYKGADSDMTTSIVDVENYKQKPDDTMTIKKYRVITDMNGNDVNIKMIDDQDEEVQLNVIQLNEEFYFYDSYHNLYDNQGVKVGEYNMGSGRGKGARGLGKRRGEIIFRDSGSSGSNGSFF
jgi:hypothetical protein